jgi:Cu+-exporting ATPase
MHLNRKWSLAVAILAVIALGGNSLWAADPVPTRITLASMHCEGCAKKVATRVQEVPGVAAVQTDVKAKRVTVVARGQTALSPRALWEAVEKAGEKPIKLEGPNGTFTKKPQS